MVYVQGKRRKSPSKNQEQNFCTFSHTLSTEPIFNYDIKYRMGKELDGGEEE